MVGIYISLKQDHQLSVAPTTPSQLPQKVGVVW